MDRFQLKIAAVTVFVTAAVIGVCFFWPAETSPIAQPKDTRKAHIGQDRDLDSQPPAPDWSSASKQNTDRQKELERMRSFSGDRGPVHSSTRHPLYERPMPARRPVRSAAGRPVESARTPAGWNVKNDAVQDRSLDFVSSFKAKDSPGRTRPPLPEAARVEIPPEKSREMYEQLLLRVSERYGNDPRAEEVKKLLLEQFRRQYPGANLGQKPIPVKPTVPSRPEREGTDIQKSSP